MAVLSCVFASALAAPSASAADVYSFANGCYGLRDTTTDRYVVRDALGYSASARNAGGATPFRMQATALGRYLLYGPDRRMPSAAPLNSVGSTAAPGPASVAGPAAPPGPTAAPAPTPARAPAAAPGPRI